MKIAVTLIEHRSHGTGINAVSGKLRDIQGDPHLTANASDDANLRNVGNLLDLFVNLGRNASQGVSNVTAGEGRASIAPSAADPATPAADSSDATAWQR